MIGLFLFQSVLFLSYANGANDNFKGVATLFGSKTAGYNKALLWGTITTFAGALLSLAFSQKLLLAFSGKGLVPDALALSPYFGTSVALSAALTVILATRLGFPISTTHAITGALVGAGLVASRTDVNISKLGGAFFAPLLLSPLLALVLTLFAYVILRTVRRVFSLSDKSCLCVTEEVVLAPQVVPIGSGDHVFASEFTVPSLSVGTRGGASSPQCESGAIGIEAKTALDKLHFLSAGLTSFARGLNDTPKLAGLLFAAPSVSPHLNLFAISMLMALGGLLSARRVAEKMSLQITEMNDGQGFSANIITSILVTSASWFGLPVSTTHVSCGSLFGIGVSTNTARWKTISHIGASWLITLPVSLLLSGSVFFILKEINQ